MNEKVSIIIPIFNSALTLPRCLDSVLSSSYENIELLLLDDGSVDESLSICKEYAEKDARIRVFHHENHGVSYTRNRGLDEATGDYVMFVDADDTISNEWVGAYVKAVQMQNTKLVIGGLRLIQKDGEEERKLPFSGLVLKEEMLKLLCEKKISGWGFVPNKLYDYKTIEEKHLKFDESMTSQEDLAFFLNYLDCVGEAYFTDETGYFYYFEDNKRAVNMFDLIKNKCRLHDISEKYNIDFARIANELSGHIYVYLKNAVLTDNFDEKNEELHAINIEWALPLLKKLSEESFVFKKYILGKYEFLKKYFKLRNILSMIGRKNG